MLIEPDLCDKIRAKRCHLMVKAVEAGRPDLERFFMACLLAHELDVLKLAMEGKI